MAAPLIGPASSLAKSAPVPDATVEAVCPPATPGTAECLALHRKDIKARPRTAVSPQTPPAGLGPADIQGAYALPSGSAGTGMTVAVVDAYDLPTAEADLATYRSQYGLPACTAASGCFRKVDQNGGSSYPIANAWWGLEIALDMEMVSAACPNCKILLVEATTATYGNLGVAVDTAVSLGAVAVSNSYGGPEDPAETSLDAHYNHPGVAITVATGDCGYNCNTGSGGVEYPSSSQYVVAVGGTTLTKDSSTRGWTETAWGHNTEGAGSGCSLYESKPSWQHDPSCAKRTVADVSAVADPATGVAVYTGGAWGVYGGTSAATPIIAAVYALAGQPAAGTYPASYPYAAPANLYDVVGGNNNVVAGQTCTVTYLCNGVAGYDGPTGLGTPNGVGAFVAPVGLTVSGYPSSTDPGVAHSLTVTATRAAGGTATDYLGTVHFTSSDPAAALPSDYTFTGSDAGVHAFNVTLSSFGLQSVTATDTVSPSTRGSQTGIFVTWPASTYTAVPPRRILDTRPTVYSGNPFNIGLSGKFVAGTVRRFAVAGAHYVGGGSAPAVPANAVAVTGNLTIVYETAPGVIDLGPAVTAGGATSSLNFVPGDTRANNVTLGLAADGYLTAVYRATAGATTDLIFDLTGYFLPGAGGATYHTVITPGRVLDTRPTYGNNIHIGPFGTLPNRSVRSFPVAGAAGLGWSSPQVPAGAVAVTGNVTVTNATSLGYVALGPTMSTFPSTSTANVAAWTNVANGVTVALSGGSLQVVWCGLVGSSADVIFDVTGYFTAGAGGLSYYPIAPSRVMDSSKNLGITGPFPSRIAQLFTLPGVPAGAAGISGNFTLIGPTTNGWALITPEIVAAPMTSTVNASAGHWEANGFDVTIGTSNHVALEWAGEVGSTANLSLDITGFWK